MNADVTLSNVTRVISTQTVASNTMATTNGTEAQKSITSPCIEGHERTEFHFLKPDYTEVTQGGLEVG